jgi:hypothetical protein
MWRLLVEGEGEGWRFYKYKYTVGASHTDGDSEGHKEHKNLEYQCLSPFRIGTLPPTLSPASKHVFREEPKGGGALA